MARLVLTLVGADRARHGGPAHQHIVSQLIDAGADLNLPDKQGVTPLHHAQQRGQRVIAQLLRAAGAH